MALPDAELLVTGFLRGHADIVALAAGVSTELPPEPTYPWLTVTRVGGVPSLAGYLDVAHLELLAWADTKADAHQLGRTAEAAVLELPGPQTGGTVTDVRQIGEGMRWNPDPASDQPRYQLLVELYIHP